MANHRHHARMHRRQDMEQAWNGFTSAVDNVWQDATGPKTVYVTQYETQVPSGYTGPLSTVVPSTSSSATMKEGPSSTSQAAVQSSSSQELVTATSSSPGPYTAGSTVVGSTALPASLAASPSESLGESLAMATSSATIPVGDNASQTFAVASASTTLNASANPSPDPSPDDSANASSNGDVGSAAKAGIAMGILAAILVVGMALFFLYNRRRKQIEQDQAHDSEKYGNPFADGSPLEHSPSTQTTGTSATAPRLSLRPVTQFLPNLNTHSDRRASRGVDIALQLSPTNGAATGAQLNRPTLGGNQWERPSTSASSNSNNPFSNDAAPANPFGDDAERIPEGPVSVTLPSPIEHEVGIATTTNSPPLPPSPISDAEYTSVETAAAGAVAAVAAVATVGLTRKQSMRKDLPKPLDLTKPTTTQLGPVPPSPTGTEYSMHSVSPGQSPGPSGGAAAIAAAGGPSQSTVHRVQLDFKPTLDDEMELQAGQLIRLLHEYDDGWALCIRLDRSQQGVVPRTCLSARPVKPRGPAQGGPRGPPLNPIRGPNYPHGQRPMTPQGRPTGPPYPHPESPARPKTAGGQSRAPGGRSMSPYGPGPASSDGGRPMIPGPLSQSQSPRQQHGRPQSPNATSSRRISPPGSSPMNEEYHPDPQAESSSIGRKPVPGQAY